MSNFNQFKEQLTKDPNRNAALQEKLSQLVVAKESGAGLVKVAVDGNKSMIAVEIDPSLINPGEREMLQDLIAAANNLAIRAVEQKIEDIIAKEL